MKKKNLSTKNLNPNRKFDTGQELINKLDNLYYKSQINKTQSVKNIFFSGIKTLKPKQKSNLNNQYSSIDSFPKIKMI